MLERGIGLGLVGVGDVWDGICGGRVESTGPGGVEAGDARRCVRAGGAGMGE